MLQTSADPIDNILLKMPLQTYGEKPPTFELVEGSGEMYMIGSEAGNYIKMLRGSIYKRYPSLWKRMATVDERKQIQKHANCQLPTHVMIVKAEEIDDLIQNDAKYKIEAPKADPNTPGAARQPRQRGAPTPWLPSVLPTTSHHLDAVPAASPISRHRIGSKRVKTFPTW